MIAEKKAPAIYQLSVERFRGLESLTWWPATGLNVVLGGGDVGKSTILDAIGLLLSPVNASTLSDTDYHGRAVEAEFRIEAVMSLPLGSGIGDQLKPSWPWEWVGGEAIVPSMEDEGKAAGEPVYRVRVRGTADLELAYEILQPDGSTDNFSVTLRRAIGLVRLSGDDRNDRDLRLVQGSALDRLLSDKGLRSRLVSGLAKRDVKGELAEGAKTALEDLDTTFKRKDLPAGLDLAITGGQGASIAALVGLTADRNGIQLPLASWGAGTRRLSALAIAEQNQGESPITLVDEVERGLEPYRQRALVAKLQAGESQVFVTTHSSPAISSASAASVWYVDHRGEIGALNSAKIARHRETNPETFLARLAIIAEGATEVGFSVGLLERALGGSLEPHGILVSDGVGHETTLDLLEGLAEGGLRFGGFADDEGKYPERWKKLSEKLGALLFRWSAGCLEENVIGAVPDEKLEALMIDPHGDKTGMRRATLAFRLGIEAKTFAEVRAKAGGGLKRLIIDAALGVVPPGNEDEKKVYKSHAQTWFKSVEGGRELADKVLGLEVLLALKPSLLTFCNAVRRAVGLSDRPDLHA